VLHESEMELRGRKFPPDQIRLAVETKARVEGLIASGAGDDVIDAARAPYVNEPWFQHIGLVPRGHWHRDWWRKVGSFDPGPYWERVRIPVLNLYGDQDVELPPLESMRAMEAAFRRGRNRKLTQHLFKGADHSLSVRRGMRPVRAPGVMDILTAWVRREAGLA